MTQQQSVALQHPCFLAGETVHPRFVRAEGHMSLLLTVNAGYE